MEFYTNFNRPPRKQESFDNQYQTVFKVTVDKKSGERILVEDKQVNVYDKIQEYKDEVSITNLLQRYNIDLLKQLKNDEEQLVDLTNMPENLMETMRIIDDAKYAWDRQSKDIKAKFNNDFNQFIASSENGQLSQLLMEEAKTQLDKFNLEHQANIQPQTISRMQNIEAQRVVTTEPATPVTPVQPVQKETQTTGGIIYNV